MKKASRNKALRPLLALLSGLTAAVFVTGCNSIQLPTQVQDLGPGYKPSNVYLRAPVLPVNVRRVVLLPLTTSSSTPFLEAGVDTLEPILYAELEKTKRFEVIPITRDQLRQWSGQPGWRADESLPPTLFAKLRADTGCNAVLFSQLTRYQPYQPVAMGWKFTLIETPEKTDVKDSPRPIIWSADEVLDSGDPAVSTSARQYYTQHLRNEAPSADVSTMMSSPTRFGQYTIAALLATLPERTPKKP